MASGYGAHGGEGRCYRFWLNFENCMINTDNPYKCDLLRDDYVECLHNAKAIDRVNMVEVETQRQAKVQEKQDKKEWEARVSKKH